MRSFFLKLIGLILATFVVSCADGGFEDESEIGVVQQSVISSADVETLIATGRAKLGTYGGQCKSWVSSIVLGSYKQTLPQTNSTYQYKWASDTTPATNVARWLGSYANGRIGPISLARNASSSVTFNVPNSDPQVVIVYANIVNVTASMTKGSSALSVSSSIDPPTSGTISSSTVVGSGAWTLTVQNNGLSAASQVVAVVLSRSRFQSDWQTAIRGDIMQMYAGTTTSKNRSLSSPHTTFVQTNSNANGTCTATDTTGCNWLDSNWVKTNYVGAHNVAMDDMIRMSAFSASYGFTIYRLN
jgi:hypothetical protein